MGIYREDKYREALEKIQKQFRHGPFKAAWEIADNVLTDYSNVSSSVSRSVPSEEEGYETTYPMFKLITIVLLIACFLMGIIALSEIHHDKGWIDKLEQRIEKLEIIETDDIKASRSEFVVFKNLTSDEFERTWRSFGIIRNNFLALGTGILCKEDITPEGEID